MEAAKHQEDPGTHRDISPVKYVETEEAYNIWAEVYDTDGNFLQALDSQEMKTLLTEFMDIPFASSDSIESPRTLSQWNVVDFGCGTGRATIALLERSSNAKICGLDFSEQMLKVAKSKVEAVNEQGRCQFYTFDAMTSQSIPAELSREFPTGTDSVVSSLVIEHLPLSNFFGAVKMILKPGGTLLLSNMHSDMGAISQAGFVKDGVKIRPQSYSHTIQEILDAAREAGFEKIGDIRERAVTKQMVEELGPRSQKWIGIVVWFSICFRRV